MVSTYFTTRLYGRPDEFRHFVNRAHEVGLGVILDVVYNHLGPDGNIRSFSEDYFNRPVPLRMGRRINLTAPNVVRPRILPRKRGLLIHEFHLMDCVLDATSKFMTSSLITLLLRLLAGREKREPAFRTHSR